MTEVTNELMYELLKRVHERMDRSDSALAEVRQEVVSIRLTQLGVQNDLHNMYGMLARLDERMERIERRLDLRELAEKPQAPYTPPQ